MFLVELSNNTINTEIQDLEKKKERKSIALQDSTAALEKDSERLIEFIEDDNMKTKKKMQEAEKAAEERRKAEAEIS